MQSNKIADLLVKEAYNVVQEVYHQVFETFVKSSHIGVDQAVAVLAGILCGHMVHSLATIIIIIHILIQPSGLSCDKTMSLFSVLHNSSCVLYIYYYPTVLYIFHYFGLASGCLFSTFASVSQRNLLSCMHNKCTYD